MKQKKGFKATYTKEAERINAKYDLDERYYKCAVRLNNCKTERQRRIVGDVPYPDLERAQAFYFSYFTIDGVEVFNAFISDFLCHFPDHIPTYIKGFKKGEKHFNKTYKVKIPTPDQVKVISDLYNNKLKGNILSIPLIYNTENIEESGFENGMLSAYSRFESDYKAQFEELFLQPHQTKKPLELADYLHNEQYGGKLPLIADKFKNSTGKEMATAIYLMDKMGILKYEYNSKTKGRKQLAEALNPKVKMNGVNKYFESNTSKSTIQEKDMETLQEWFSGLVVYSG